MCYLMWKNADEDIGDTATLDIQRVIKETEKAFYVRLSRDYGGRAFWFPKSHILELWNVGIKVTKWIADQNGIGYEDE